MPQEGGLGTLDGLGRSLRIQSHSANLAASSAGGLFRKG